MPLKLAFRQRTIPTFGVWADSHGAAGNLQTNILTGPAVLHLTGDDIYLDIQFTAWDRAVSDGGQAGFTFDKSLSTSPGTEL